MMLLSSLFNVIICRVDVLGAILLSQVVRLMAITIIVVNHN
jgi:hypothetical protein